MTLEEIGADFLFGIMKIKQCCWTSIRGASYYFRPNTPFGTLIHQGGKIDPDPILRQMGIDSERYDELENVMFPNLLKPANLAERTKQ